MSTNRAVIYARYSSNKQSEQSIEGQLRDCYAYAEKHDITIVGEYIDPLYLLRRIIDRNFKE